MTTTLCSCGYEAPTGCRCSFDDSDSISVNKVSGQATRRQLDPIIDPRTDNLASCGVGGMLAIAPTRFRLPPSAWVSRSTTQSISDNTESLLTFDVEQFDNDNIFAATSSVLAVRTSGIYAVWCSVRWTANATGFRMLRCLINGFAEVAGDLFFANNSSAVCSNHVATLQQVVVNDTFSFQVLQNSGGALSTVAATGDDLSACSAGMAFLGDV